MVLKVNPKFQVSIDSGRRPGSLPRYLSHCNVLSCFIPNPNPTLIHTHDTVAYSMASEIGILNLNRKFLFSHSVFLLFSPVCYGQEVALILDHERILREILRKFGREAAPPGWRWDIL
jgi:hypothetical protein